MEYPALSWVGILDRILHILAVMKTRMLALVLILSLGVSFTLQGAEQEADAHFAPLPGVRARADIEGMAPEDFYKQFVDTNPADETNSDPSPARSPQAIRTGINSHYESIDLKNGVYGNVEITLYPDGTFVYKYSEWKKTDSGLPTLLFSKTGKEKWTVRGTKLHFEGLGDATGTRSFEIGNKMEPKLVPVLIFSFAKDIRLPGLTDGSLVMSR